MSSKLHLVTSCCQFTAVTFSASRDLNISHCRSGFYVLSIVSYIESGIREVLKGFRVTGQFEKYRTLSTIVIANRKSLCSLHAYDIT